MSEEERKKWQQKYPKGKASLSWNLKDYLSFNEEPPPCVLKGITEGESMDEELLEKWCLETMKYLSVLKEEYPKKFEEQYNEYLLDLEYLFKIGKITKEEKEKLKKKENFNFGVE